MTVPPAAGVDGECSAVCGDPVLSPAESFAEADAVQGWDVVAIADVALEVPLMAPRDEVLHAANNATAMRPAMQGASGLLTLSG